MTDQAFKQEDYRGMMILHARRAWARLERAGIPVDFNDVMQEAGVIFSRARHGFDAGRGVKFSTYLWNALNNSLNRFCDQQRDRARGQVSIDAEIDEDGGSLLSILPDTTARDPAETLERRQTALETVKGFTFETRLVIANLVAPGDALKAEVARMRAFSKRCSKTDMVAPRITFNMEVIMEIAGFDKRAKIRVRREIKTFLEQA